MNAVAVDLGVGIVVFAATNLDDMLLLAAFFADARMSRRAIVAGQFLGIGALVAAAVLAARLALAVPAGWIALLGFVPLVLGLAKLRDLRRAKAADAESDESDHRAARETDGRRPWGQALAVGAVTIAHGGDNLGAWIPLFAHSPEAVAMHAISFALLTGLWCVAGAWLTSHRVLGAALRHRGHGILPVVLVALGLFILADARMLLA